MMRRFHYWTLVAVAFGVGVLSACQMVLGDYDVWGADRECTKDTDCSGASEGCDKGYKGTCRTRCEANSSCDHDAGYITCPSYPGLCPDPIGAPCTEDDYGDDTCGTGTTCLAKSMGNKEVRGYCTVACRETDSGPPCPNGYQCDPEGMCLCMDDWCEKQFEQFLGDLP